MRKRKRIVLVFLLFVIYHGNGQILNSFSEVKKSKLSYAEKVVKIDSLALYAESIAYDSLAHLYRKYAYWLYDYDLPKTIILSEKAKHITFTSNDIDSTLRYKINVDLGYYYNKNYEYSNAISRYRQALDWTDSKKKSSKTYEQIAKCYDQLKDYFRAVKNYKIAAGLLNHSETHIERLMILNYNISILLSKQNTKDSQSEAAKYAKKVDSLYQIYSQLKKYGFTIKFHHAEIYNHDLNLDTILSSKYYQDAYDLARNQLDTVGMIETLYGRGSLFNSTNQEKSKQFHYKALSLIDKLDSTNLFLNWHALGKTFAYEGKYSESSQYLIKSLRYLTGIDFSDPHSLIDQNILFLKNADNLIHNLPLLGEVYLKWYEETKNKTYLDKSIGYFQITDKIIDHQKLNSKDFLSRLFWRKESTDLYGKALRVCYLLEDYNQAFYFMEKNKALLLMEDISQNELKKSLSQYPEYFQREKVLKENIYSLSNQLKGIYESSKNFDLLKLKNDLEIDLSLLQDSIYGYKKSLQYDPAHLKIADVQKKLNDNEVFVEYHLSVDNEHGIYSNNEKGYVMILSKDNKFLLEIGRLEELYSDIRKITTLIKAPLDTKSEIEEYNTLAYRLYNTLFPDSDVRALIRNKKLFLSLDYYLHFLPFEALSTSPDRPEYLIEKTEISYVYSYIFGENNNSSRQPEKNEIIAFAPQEFQDQNLISLNFTEREITAIKDKIEGKYYQKSEALKKRFIDESPKYGVIHLATHAYSSADSTPWISFYDEKLTLEELYLIENNASLVVLSACKTNIGKLEIGEGVMSLARGFFYGGTQSVISTLWNVDDKSTSFILEQFYKNIKLGKNKSEALHHAKLNYLEKNSHSELSPYYWSSFVLLGDTSSLEFENFTLSNTTYILFFVSIVLIIILLLKFFKK